MAVVHKRLECTGITACITGGEALIGHVHKNMVSALQEGGRDGLPLLLVWIDLQEVEAEHGAS